MLGTGEGLSIRDITFSFETETVVGFCFSAAEPTESSLVNLFSSVSQSIKTCKRGYN
jgi:hypothetical protein